VQVDPIKPESKPPGTKRLKLKCDILLSTSAFKFNLRRYTEGAALVEELRRWKEEWAEGVSVANARGGGGEGWGGGGGGGHGGGAIGGGGGFTRNDPSSAGCGLSPASLAPMLSGAVFTLRQKAGPARFSSPRHGIPINSSNEGSKCVLRRGGQ
jgi:hypothetical protein